MFDDIGKKIKGLATVIYVLGVIASVLGGGSIAFATREYSRFGYSFTAGGVITGLITMALGAVLSWAGSLSLYGFGELIDNMNTMKYNVNTMTELVKKIEKRNVTRAGKDNSDLYDTSDKNIAATDADINAIMGMDESQKVVYVNRQARKIQCPFCGTVQSTNRSLCFLCSAKFEDASK